MTRATQQAPVSGVVAPEKETPVLATALPLLLEGERVTIRVGRAEHIATLDPSVHPSVIATAIARSERIVVEGCEGAWLIVGALRTSPTPGIEEGEEYEIRAGRVKIRAQHEFTVASGSAAFAVRAYGAVETFAEQITTRASAVHKIIGRMLHLN
jgi:hypothetical protein